MAIRNARRSEPEEPLPEAVGGFGGFFGQALSGAALLVLLTLHMIAQHFLVKDGLRRYDEVIDWLGNPIMIGLEIAFLVFVTWHALLGVRAILFDFGLSSRTERAVTRVLMVVGVLTVVYGVWLLAAILAAG